MTDAISLFGTAMAEAGYNPGEVIADGRIHRFSMNGKQSDKAGWYWLNTDGPVTAGIFGDWRTGKKIKWSSKSKSEMSSGERKAYGAAIEAAKRQREAELRRVNKAVSDKAAKKFKSLPDATDDHPYLKKKRVPSFGLKICNDELLVPFRDATGKIWTFERIMTSGEKRFWADGKKKGCFFIIPGSGDTEYLVEGYATGATVHMATGATVIVCGDAGNLLTVGETLRNTHPEAKIRICADDDQWKDGNTGVTKARAAATRIGATVFFPRFKDTSTKPTDFNDLHQLEGIEIVQQQLSGPQTIDIAPGSPITDILKRDKLLAEFYDTLNRNEEGDAELIKRRYEGKLVFDHIEGSWYRFSKHHWRRDDIQKVKSVLVDISDLYVKASVRCLDELKNLTIQRARDPEDTEKEKGLILQGTVLNGLQKNFLKRAKHLRTDARAKNVLSWAAAGEPLAVTSEVWETDPYILGVKNGVVDLRTRKLRPGRPEDYIRTFINFEFDIKATCPNWERFLMDIFAQPNRQDTLALVDYFQDLLGYTLIGISTEPVFVVLYGRGRNGKSTLLEVVAEILGPYAHKANSELVLKKSKPSNIGAPDADTLALRHKRLVYCAETDEGRRLDANRVKHLTGNDRLQARGPYERRPTEFQPTHTLFLITNDKPQIRSDDYAVWQRVKPVPMLTSFVDHPEGSYQRRAIKNMKDILLKEAIGILAWMIKGAPQYLTDGLTTPPVILNEAKEYRIGESLIIAWADERCIVMPSVGQLAKELFASFNEYLGSNGFKSWTNKAFIAKLEKELADRGVRKREKYTNQGAFFDGIGLRGEAR